MSRVLRRAERRSAALMAAAVLSLGVVTGCQGSPSSAPETTAGAAASNSSAASAGPGTRVDLAVRDFALRPLESTCSGARPFLDLRPGAKVVVTDTSGTGRATGRLPEGSAIKATNIDFETATREPTFCLFALEVTPALAPGTYTLTAGEGRAMTITVDDSDAVTLASYPTVGSPEDVLGPNPSASVTP